MNWAPLVDIGIFLGFIVAVIAFALWSSRRKASVEDYFLAGRSLVWPVIGFSLIAANINSEHFVGMAGTAFKEGGPGLAIGSYEWMSAITLVIVAWYFLPKFLSAGIYTMPQFLEYRYDSGTRTIMAAYLLVAYVIVLLATVLFSGAIALCNVMNLPELFMNRFGMDAAAADKWAMIAAIWFIGIVGGAYTAYGGLSAVVWADLIQGSALLIGAGITGFFALNYLGGGNVIEGWNTFTEGSADKLHMVRSWNDPDVPWLAVFFGGLWIPNIFYWGLNQFITQRTLAAKNLAEGQKGILFAACLKLLIPFLIVMPGIMAYQIYGNVLARPEEAYPHLMKTLLPMGFRGAMFAALAGAIISTVNSGLNSAATIFTIDLYGKYVNPNLDSRKEMIIGRVSTVIIVIVACLWAPIINNFPGVFPYIQEIWGFISPGIVAAFLGGLIFKYAPVTAGKGALLLGPVLYALVRVPGWIIKAQYLDAATGTVSPPEGLLSAIYTFSTLAFLHHMAIIFLILFAYVAVVAKVRPNAAVVIMPKSDVDITPDPKVYWLGAGVILATVVLYIIWF
ncbi:MAG: Sodium/glucose cotransporter [Candidatus Hydrogenedentes bacterium ADurb.Bin179]|nr:MAG: Sodium/glucose cotransporter [Candidatus Hydrogenedentes bacterium ADurb.Bin179]